ncbi:uncharacterized protein SPPG_07958 [Spizellomyces punctatus DAOM BR117]|uniref:DUF676 domain-containing protein n=1 Tax=Spizellomyces punctatus (strain DAOM BR117) TaxID=645134 RepID=A0A0L0H5G7_SPIPD|nr:uncharacterized protein SPPG_07958 [Spizellomyces punctatus DAOM BR117]KNC96750.1 hypothetical protein SPPG_07958 [Spizellomyces punctatus DAOM BR117]|eukprot:XP_016604790.1 hypothetical protein SPPG_07958 [Spizellomyces punctatus DAOM BR117]
MDIPKPCGEKQPRKTVEVVLQLADFTNIDVYLRGLYQFHCRLYALVPVYERGRLIRRDRVDGIPTILLPTEEQGSFEPVLPFVAETSKELRYNCFPSYVMQRQKCPLHQVCSWKCRPSQNSSTPNVWITKSFYISREAERVALHTGVVFRIDLDVTLGEIEPLEDESGQWDAHLDIELWHCEDERMANPDDFTFQQLRRFRLSKLLSSNSPSTQLHQYASVCFSSPFFSACSLLVSASTLGYHMDDPVEIPRTVIWEDSGLGNVLGRFWKQWIPSDSSNGVDPRHDRLADVLSDELHRERNTGAPFTPLSADGGLSAFGTYYTKLVYRSLHILLTLYLLVGNIRVSSIEDASLTAHLTAHDIAAVFKCVLGGDGAEEGLGEDEDDTSIDHADKLRILRYCDDILQEYLQSETSSLIFEERMGELLERLLHLSRTIWMTFLKQHVMLSLAEVAVLRSAWAKRNYSLFCRHIIPAVQLPARGGLTRIAHESILRQRFPAMLVSEERQLPIPIVIDQTTLQFYVDRPLSPISIAAFRRPRTWTMSSGLSLAPSEYGQSSVKSLMGSPLLDEDASVMGIRPPRSVMSDNMSITNVNSSDTAGNHVETELEWLVANRSDMVTRGGCHLVVFVHGLLGSAYDFRQLKNKVIYARHNFNIPSNGIVFLNSNCNEEDTLDDISVLADHLVSEIVEFVTEERLRVERMSFVCHSLGGIIARCAIEKPGMEIFRDKYDTFITLATPHLSGALSKNRLLTFLATMYQCIDRSACIDQLLMKDNANLQESFMYKLATNASALGAFKCVRLLASSQDGYADVESALIGLGGAREIQRACGQGCIGVFGSCESYSRVDAEGTASTGDDQSDQDAYKDMLVALSGVLAGAKVERYIVWFPSLAGTTDFLGRRAHVAMLEDPMFLEMAVVICRLLL